MVSMKNEVIADDIFRLQRELEKEKLVAII